MGYIPEMKELIKRVEATRSERVAMAKRGENFPALSLEERAEVLNKYHPDYQQEGRRALRVGPNKGEVFPEEVAQMLESKSMLRPDCLDLSRIDYDTDVLIIGGGGAGTSAQTLADDAGSMGVWYGAPAALGDEVTLATWVGSLNLSPYALIAALTVLPTRRAPAAALIGRPPGR